MKYYRQYAKKRAMLSCKYCISPCDILFSHSLEFICKHIILKKNLLKIYCEI